MLPRLIGLLLLALFAAAAVHPAAAADPPRFDLKHLLDALDEPDVPAAWGGIWDTEIEMRICETPTVIFSDAYTDTLCPGEAVDPGEQEVPITCTGTANDQTILMSCTATQEIMPGCTLNMTVDYSGSRNDDAYTVNMVVNSTYTGDCFGVSDSCFEATITGERVGPAPAVCSTPVDEVTWGTIKSLYE